MAQHISQLLAHLTEPSTQWKLSLLQNWQQIIGNLSTKVTIEKILNDTVVLGVYDSCWLQELYLLSPTLVHMINTHLGQPHIKGIRLRLIANKKTKQTRLAYRAIHLLPSYEFSKQELKALEKIPDPVLQEALKRFRIRCHQESI